MALCTLMPQQTGCSTCIVAHSCASSDLRYGDNGAPATRLVGMLDTGQTDFSDRIKTLQLRERPLVVVPLLPLYRKMRVEVTIASVGVQSALRNRTTARHLSALLQGSWPAQTRAAARPSLGHGHRRRSSTHCEKLSDRHSPARACGEPAPLLVPSAASTRVPLLSARSACLCHRPPHCVP